MIRYTTRYLGLLLNGCKMVLGFNVLLNIDQGSILISFKFRFPFLEKGADTFHKILGTN